MVSVNKERVASGVAKIAAVLLVSGLSGCSSARGSEDRVFVMADISRSSQASESGVGHRVIASTVAERVPLSQSAARVRQVLVMHDHSAGRPTALKRTHAEAYERATSVRDLIVAGGDFGSIAREYSDCPSGRFKGGDVGLIRRGETATVFEEALFSLEENQVSAIVETDFGFHIIQRIPQDGV